MEKMKLDEIKKKIDKVRVIGYDEGEVIAGSKFMSVVKGSYTLNNSRVIEREKIIKNIGNGNAVCVFAVTCDLEVLLVIQPRVGLVNDSKVNVELSAGYIENNEDSITAAKRELKEETGYVCNKLIHLDSYFPSLGGSGERVDLVLALDCEKKKEQKLDSDEVLEYTKVSIAEFRYLLYNNYMMDANCRIAYFKALEYLNNYLFEKIVNKLRKKKKTISLMESCTGGYLASCITNINNSSEVLEYSVVSYSDKAKINLGVNSEVISKYSVYSLECVREMAYHVSDIADSNYGVGVSGRLDNNDNVYISIYNKDSDKYYDYNYYVSNSNRIDNKMDLGLFVVDKLLEILKEE